MSSRNQDETPKSEERNAPTEPHVETDDLNSRSSSELASDVAIEILEAIKAELPESTMPDRELIEQALNEAANADQAGCADGKSFHEKRSGWMLFCPHRMVESVTQVTPESLSSRCISGVILDLDNTLVLWRQEEMTDAILAWLTSLREAGLKMCILSNSVLSKRSQRIGERLGCHYVRQARKPSRTGFRKAMALMGTTPASTAIVGDQMFTDILGGNRTGLYTVMVHPLHKHEFPYTRYVSRPPENLLLRWFKRKGHI